MLKAIAELQPIRCGRATQPAGMLQLTYFFWMRQAEIGLKTPSP
jgi:hypothetical protein